MYFSPCIFFAAFCSIFVLVYRVIIHGGPRNSSGVLTVGILLLRYSVVCTVESFSLCYLLYVRKINKKL